MRSAFARTEIDGEAVNNVTKLAREKRRKEKKSENLEKDSNFVLRMLYKNGQQRAVCACEPMRVCTCACVCVCVCACVCVCEPTDNLVT